MRRDEHARTTRLARARTRRGEPRGERGAAAVEFALVLTVLLPVMCGIVDYGMWFADSLAVRHGVHEAARLGVVQRSACTSAATGLAKIACSTVPQIGIGRPASERATASDRLVWVKVNVPDGWGRGKPLVVCAMVEENGVTGMTPMPGRFVRAKAEMAIEVDTPVLTSSATTAGSAGDAAPSGTDWSWCT